MLNRAIAFHKLNQLSKAKLLYKEILQSENNKNAYYMLGLLYSQEQSYLSAIQQLEKSLPLFTKVGAFYNALTICYQKMGHFRVANRLIDIAISLEKTNKNYLNRKSKILICLGKLQPCIDNSQHCIKLHPTFFPAYQSHALASNQMFRPDNTLRIIKRASLCIKNNTAVSFSLAQAYQYVGNYKKSVMIYKALIAVKYKIPECLNNLGNLEREYGDLHIAKKIYQEALSHHPQNDVALLNISLLNLLSGEYADGWNYYDHRLNTNKLSAPDINAKEWKGDNLEEKTIAILSEQGLGDEILFSSSYNHIIKEAEIVHIFCDSRLTKIFKKSFPRAKIYDKSNQENYKYLKVDFKVYAGSLLKYIQHPHISRQLFLIAPNTSLLDKKKLNIGFSWKGGGKYHEIKKRSIQLKHWLPLINEKKFNFYCLQHNLSKIDRKTLTNNADNCIIIDSISINNEIESLTNLIAGLDLVISVTNTNVHIAGALGIETWCLTPHNPDWPWGLTNTKCKWYDSVDIVRKKGDKWISIFDTINKKLTRLTSMKESM